MCFDKNCLFIIINQSLKTLDLQLLNMAEFTDSLTADNRWMKHLNELNRDTNTQFELILTDEFDQSKFGEDYFCMFKDFPHDNHVFPVS